MRYHVIYSVLYIIMYFATGLRDDLFFNKDPFSKNSSHKLENLKKRQATFPKCLYYDKNLENYSEYFCPEVENLQNVSLIKGNGKNVIFFKSRDILSKKTFLDDATESLHLQNCKLQRKRRKLNNFKTDVNLKETFRKKRGLKARSRKFNKKNIKNRSKQVARLIRESSNLTGISGKLSKNSNNLKKGGNLVSRETNLRTNNEQFKNADQSGFLLKSRQPIENQLSVWPWLNNYIPNYQFGNLPMIPVFNNQNNPLQSQINNKINPIQLESANFRKLSANNFNQTEKNKSNQLKANNSSLLKNNLSEMKSKDFKNFKNNSYKSQKHEQLTNKSDKLGSSHFLRFEDNPNVFYGAVNSEFSRPYTSSQDFSFYPIKDSYGNLYYGGNLFYPNFVNPDYLYNPINQNLANATKKSNILVKKSLRNDNEKKSLSEMIEPLTGQLQKLVLEMKKLNENLSRGKNKGTKKDNVSKKSVRRKRELMTYKNPSNLTSLYYESLKSLFHGSERKANFSKDLKNVIGEDGSHKIKSKLTDEEILLEENKNKDLLSIFGPKNLIEESNEKKEAIRRKFDKRGNFHNINKKKKFGSDKNFLVNNSKKREMHYKKEETNVTIGEINHEKEEKNVEKTDFLQNNQDKRVKRCSLKKKENRKFRDNLISNLRKNVFKHPKKKKYVKLVNKKQVKKTTNKRALRKDKDLENKKKNKKRNQIIFQIGKSNQQKIRRFGRTLKSFSEFGDSYLDYENRHKKLKFDNISNFNDKNQLSSLRKEFFYNDRPKRAASSTEDYETYTDESLLTTEMYPDEEDEKETEKSIWSDYSSDIEDKTSNKTKTSINLVSSTEAKTSTKGLMKSSKNVESTTEAKTSPEVKTSNDFKISTKDKTATTTLLVTKTSKSAETIVSSVTEGNIVSTTFKQETSKTSKEATSSIVSSKSTLIEATTVQSLGSTTTEIKNEAKDSSTGSEEISVKKNTEAKVTETSIKTKSFEATTEARATETANESKSFKTTIGSKTTETEVEAKFIETSTEAKATETVFEAKFINSSDVAKTTEAGIVATEAKTTEAKTTETGIEATSPEKTNEAKATEEKVKAEPLENSTEVAKATKSGIEATLLEITTEAKATKTGIEATTIEADTEAKATQTGTYGNSMESSNEAKTTEAGIKATSPESSTEAISSETKVESESLETSTEATKVTKESIEATSLEITTEEKATEADIEALSTEAATEAKDTETGIEATSPESLTEALATETKVEAESLETSIEGTKATEAGIEDTSLGITTETKTTETGIEAISSEAATEANYSETGIEAKSMETSNEAETTESGIEATSMETSTEAKGTEEGIKATSLVITKPEATVTGIEAKSFETDSEAITTEKGIKTTSSEATTGVVVTETGIEAISSEASTEAKSTETGTEANSSETGVEATSSEASTEAKFTETGTEANSSETGIEATLSEASTEAKSTESGTEANSSETTIEGKSSEVTVANEISGTFKASESVGTATQPESLESSIEAKFSETTTTESLSSVVGLTEAFDTTVAVNVFATSAKGKFTETTANDNSIETTTNANSIETTTAVFLESKTNSEEKASSIITGIKNMVSTEFTLPLNETTTEEIIRTTETFTLSTTLPILKTGILKSSTTEANGLSTQEKIVGKTLTSLELLTTAEMGSSTEETLDAVETPVSEEISSSTETATTEEIVSEGKVSTKETLNTEETSSSEATSHKEVKTEETSSTEETSTVKKSTSSEENFSTTESLSSEETSSVSGKFSTKQKSSTAETSRAEETLSTKKTLKTEEASSTKKALNVDESVTVKEIPVTKETSGIEETTKNEELSSTQKTLNIEAILSTTETEDIEKSSKPEKSTETVEMPSSKEILEELRSTVKTSEESSKVDTGIEVTVNIEMTTGKTTEEEETGDYDVFYDAELKNSTMSYEDDLEEDDTSESNTPIEWKEYDESSSSEPTMGDEEGEKTVEGTTKEEEKSTKENATTKEVTTEKETTTKATTKETTTEKATTEEATTKETTTEKATTEEVTTAEATTEEATTKETTTEEVTTEEATTKETTTEEVTTEEATTKETITEEVTTEESTTKETTTEEVTTEEATTKETATEEVTTEEATAEEVTTEEATIEENTAEATTEKETTEETTAEQNTNDEEETEVTTEEEAFKKKSKAGTEEEGEQGVTVESGRGKALQKEGEMKENEDEEEEEEEEETTEEESTDENENGKEGTKNEEKEDEGKEEVTTEESVTEEYAKEKTTGADVTEEIEKEEMSKKTETDEEETTVNVTTNKEIIKENTAEDNEKNVEETSKCKEESANVTIEEETTEEPVTNKIKETSESKCSTKSEHTEKIKSKLDHKSKSSPKSKLTSQSKCKSTPKIKTIKISKPTPKAKQVKTPKSTPKSETICNSTSKSDISEKSTSTTKSKSSAECTSKLKNPESTSAPKPKFTSEIVFNPESVASASKCTSDPKMVLSSIPNGETPVQNPPEVVIVIEETTKASFQTEVASLEEQETSILTEITSDLRSSEEELTEESDYPESVQDQEDEFETQLKKDQEEEYDTQLEKNQEEDSTTQPTQDRQKMIDNHLKETEFERKERLDKIRKKQKELEHKQCELHKKIKQVENVIRNHAESEETESMSTSNVPEEITSTARESDSDQKKIDELLEKKTEKSRNEEVDELSEEIEETSNREFPENKSVTSSTQTVCLNVFKNANSKEIDKNKKIVFLPVLQKDASIKKKLKRLTRKLMTLSENSSRSNRQFRQDAHKYNFLVKKTNENVSNLTESRQRLTRLKRKAVLETRQMENSEKSNFKDEKDECERIKRGFSFKKFWNCVKQPTETTTEQEYDENFGMATTDNYLSTLANKVDIQSNPNEAFEIETTSSKMLIDEKYISSLEAEYSEKKNPSITFKTEFTKSSEEVSTKKHLLTLSDKFSGISGSTSGVDLTKKNEVYTTKNNPGKFFDNFAPSTEIYEHDFDTEDEICEECVDGVGEEECVEENGEKKTGDEIDKMKVDVKGNKEDGKKEGVKNGKEEKKGEKENKLGRKENIEKGQREDVKKGWKEDGEKGRKEDVNSVKKIVLKKGKEGKKEENEDNVKDGKKEGKSTVNTQKSTETDDEDKLHIATESYKKSGEGKDECDEEIREEYTEDINKEDDKKSSMEEKEKVSKKEGAIEEEEEDKEEEEAKFKGKNGSENAIEDKKDETGRGKKKNKEKVSDKMKNEFGCEDNGKSRKEDKKANKKGRKEEKIIGEKEENKDNVDKSGTKGYRKEGKKEGKKEDKKEGKERQKVDDLKIGEDEYDEKCREEGKEKNKEKESGVVKEKNEKGEEKSKKVDGMKNRKKIKVNKGKGGDGCNDKKGTEKSVEENGEEDNEEHEEEDEESVEENHEENGSEDNGNEENGNDENDNEENGNEENSNEEKSNEENGNEENGNEEDSNEDNNDEENNEEIEEKKNEETTEGGDYEDKNDDEESKKENNCEEEIKIGDKSTDAEKEDFDSQNSEKPVTIKSRNQTELKFKETTSSQVTCGLPLIILKGNKEILKKIQNNLKFTEEDKKISLKSSLVTSTLSGITLTSNQEKDQEEKEEKEDKDTKKDNCDEEIIPSIDENEKNNKKYVDSSNKMIYNEKDSLTGSEKEEKKKGAHSQEKEKLLLKNHVSSKAGNLNKNKAKTFAVDEKKIVKKGDKILDKKKEKKLGKEKHKEKVRDKEEKLIKKVDHLLQEVDDLKEGIIQNGENLKKSQTDLFKSIVSDKTQKQSEGYKINKNHRRKSISRQNSRLKRGTKVPENTKNDQLEKLKIMPIDFSTNDAVKLDAGNLENFKKLEHFHSDGNKIHESDKNNYNIFDKLVELVKEDNKKKRKFDILKTSRKNLKIKNLKKKRRLSRSTLDEVRHVISDLIVQSDNLKKQTEIKGKNPVVLKIFTNDSLQKGSAIEQPISNISLNSKLLKDNLKNDTNAKLAFLTLKNNINEASLVGENLQPLKEFQTRQAVLQNKSQFVNLDDIILKVKDTMQKRNLGDIEKIIIYVDKTNKDSKLNTRNVDSNLYSDKKNDEISVRENSLDEIVSLVTNKVIKSINNSHILPRDSKIFVKVVQPMNYEEKSPSEELKAQFQLDLSKDNKNFQYVPLRNRENYENEILTENGRGSGKLESSNFNTWLKKYKGERRMNLSEKPLKKRRYWHEKIKKDRLDDRILTEIRREVSKELRKQFQEIEDPSGNLNFGRERRKISGQLIKKRKIREFTENLKEASDSEDSGIEGNNHNQEEKNLPDLKIKAMAEKIFKFAREIETKGDKIKSVRGVDLERIVNKFAENELGLYNKRDKKAVNKLINEIVKVKKNVDTTLNSINKKFNQSKDSETFTISKKNLGSKKTKDSKIWAGQLKKIFYQIENKEKRDKNVRLEKARDEIKVAFHDLLDDSSSKNLKEKTLHLKVIDSQNHLVSKQKKRKNDFKLKNEKKDGNSKKKVKPSKALNLKMTASKEKDVEKHKKKKKVNDSGKKKDKNVKEDFTKKDQTSKKSVKKPKTDSSLKKVKKNTSNFGKILKYKSRKVQSVNEMQDVNQKKIKEVPDRMKLKKIMDTKFRTLETEVFEKKSCQSNGAHTVFEKFPKIPFYTSNTTFCVKHKIAAKSIQAQNNDENFFENGVSANNKNVEENKNTGNFEMHSFGRHLCYYKKHENVKNETKSINLESKVTRDENHSRHVLEKMRKNSNKKLIADNNLKLDEKFSSQAGKKNLVKNRKIRENENAKKVIRENCENCICDLSQVASDLTNMLGNRSILLDRIENYQCNLFTDIGNEILISDGSMEAVNHIRRNFDETKGLKYIESENLLDALKSGIAANDEHEIFTLPGFNLNLQCNYEGEDSMWMMSISKPNYTWSREDKFPITGVVRKDGNLELYDVDTKDTGNYFCSVNYIDPENEEFVKNTFRHSVQVVTLPRYALRGGSRYKLDVCDDAEIEEIVTFLPKKLNEILCKNDICEAFLFPPNCQHQRIAINVLVAPSNIEKLVPVGLNICGIRCRKAVQDKIALILSRNVRTVLQRPIVFRLPHHREKLVPVDLPNNNHRSKRCRNKKYKSNKYKGDVGLLIGCPAGYNFKNTHCLPCLSGFYSEDGSSQCKKCPLGTHQPNTGARACQACTNPFVEGCHEMIVNLSTIIVILAILLIVVLIFSIVLCSCMRRPKNEKIKACVRPTEIEPKNDSDKQPMLNYKKKRKLNSNREIIILRPEAKKKIVKDRSDRKLDKNGYVLVSCVDSYHSHQGVCCNKSPKKSCRFKPPVPEPDFDR